MIIDQMARGSSDRWNSQFMENECVGVLYLLVVSVVYLHSTIVAAMERLVVFHE